MAWVGTGADRTGERPTLAGGCRNRVAFLRGYPETAQDPCVPNGSPGPCLPSPSTVPTCCCSTSCSGLGLQAFVRVQLNHHDSAAIAAFSDFVTTWDEVVACHALTGDMDYLLHVVVRDLEHFSRFLLDRLLNQAGVDDVNSSFVLRTVKAFRGLPLPR